MKLVLRTLFCLFTLSLLSVAHADTPLETSMKKMGKAFKQLNLDMKAPQEASKADYVALAATMKTEAQVDRDLVPKKASDLPADQQAAMVTDYQKSIDQLIAAIDVLSGQLQNSQWPEATKQLADIKKMMTDGHKSFRKKD